MMIDIHSHIIFNADDGAPDAEESLRMITKAGEQGIRVIFATPHFMDGLFDTDAGWDGFQVLREKAKGAGVALYPGSEVYLSPDLPQLLKQKKQLTLGNSRFVLLELPYGSVPSYTQDVLFKLHQQEFYPILAHPERNRYFLNHLRSFHEVLGMGCLIQLDAASIAGIYGIRVRRFAKGIIRERLAHFVASNAHSSGDYAGRYLEAYRQTIEWADKEYAELLFSGNAERIVRPS